MTRESFHGTCGISRNFMPLIMFPLTSPLPFAITASTTTFFNLLLHIQSVLSSLAKAKIYSWCLTFNIQATQKHNYSKECWELYAVIYIQDFAYNMTKLPNIWGGQVLQLLLYQVTSLGWTTVKHTPGWGF